MQKLLMIVLYIHEYCPDEVIGRKMPATNAVNYHAIIENLKVEYEAKLGHHSLAIQKKWAEYKNLSSADSLQEFHFLVHFLAGTGETYGYPAITWAAREIEMIIIQNTRQNRSPTAPELARIEAMLEQIYASAKEVEVKTGNNIQENLH
ncbi:MAG: Hpt domain-containing protein [Alphaproteobacteria bacterium]